MNLFQQRLKTITYLLMAIGLSSCTNQEIEPVVNGDALVFTLLLPKETGIDFSNTSIESVERNLGGYDYFYNGSGVAIGDLNNDGLAEIFFAGNDTANRLYLNEGGLNFKDISSEAGFNTTKWATGVSLVDINDDGYLDIYVCSSGPYEEDAFLANELYINNGDLTFTESAVDYGIAGSSYSSQATFFDMDKDGDLDLFVMNHSLLNYGASIQELEQVLESDSDKLRRSCSTLYRNEGNASFTDITAEAGLLRAGFGLGVSISDFDENGYLDIFVSNDYFVPDFMFFNMGDGVFVENIEASASHTSYYSMGCDAADFNNDGLVDLTVVDMTPADHFRGKTQMESMDTDKFKFLVETYDFIPQYMFNTLGLNRSKGNFSEIALLAGVSQTDWSWAPLLVDLNNDSWKDLVVTNGFKRDTKDRDWANQLDRRFKEEGKTPAVFFDQLQKAKSTPLINYIYENKGDLTFVDRSESWGFIEPSFSQGAAYGDLDNDGDLDLVINNLEKAAFVYRNNTSEKRESHYIQFTLSNSEKTADVQHSKIKIFSEGQIQLVEYSFERGYLSSMQPLAHFGLGTARKVDKVEILWPDGKMSVIREPKIDSKHHIDKSKQTLFNPSNPGITKPFMDIASQAKGLQFKHQENTFNDFEKEILLPQKQSTLGPCLSVGDVNGDGIEDFFVGGAKGQSAQLYLQDLSQGIVFSEQDVFRLDAKYEDLGSLFFDADGDGDLDLYVASGGGGDLKEGSLLLQDRLYINNGSGSFTKSRNSLPKITASTASVTANDWDMDGDLDLFVGGRNTPGKYPLPPDSYLLENDKGVFKDITSSFGQELRKIGMVTSACWSDINNDGNKDILIAGEWMPITVFVHTSSGFVNATDEFGLSDSKGWWYNLRKGDFDNDGDDDFIAGNLGLNNKFHATKDKPLHIFSNDFDDNGTLDIVLSKLYNGNLAPVRGKDCSSAQMPFISEKFSLFSDFASSSLEAIYGPQKLSEALHYEANNFASMYIENRGDGSFDMRPLPSEAQLAPLNDMVIWDFDKDGNLDVIVAGNMYNTEVETPSYDAGKGLYMKGNGDGTFKSYPNIDDSGIFMPLNVKALQLILLSEEKRPAILVANNNDRLQLFAWTR